MSTVPVFRFGFGTHPDAARAFEIQRQRAIAHGQQWSEAHANALRELQEAYILTGLGISRRRTAWPLAVGTGKSESIVAFVRAQFEAAERGGEPLTLLVCMERAAQLRDLYNAIMETGVPASFVGTFHRKSPAEVKAEGLTESISLADAPRYPILLATHAKMLRGEGSIAEVNTFNGKPRSLVIWDESLIKSRGQHLDLARIEAANAVFGAAVKDSTGEEDRDAREAYGLLAMRLQILREDFARQLQGHKACPIVPANVAEEDELRFHAALASVLQRRGARDMERGAFDLLSDFLEHIQRPVRVLPYVEAGRRVGVIHFETLIPPSLSRLIVLDASHNVRLLTGEHDSELSVTPVNCAVKSFNDVTVRHLRVGAGRGSLENCLPRRDSVVLREIVSELKSWPDHEAGIIVTFKQHPKDRRYGKLSHAEHVQLAMRDAGLDAGSTLPDGRPRFVFITWGQHLGVNDYAHCRHVLLVGVLRRTPLDLAAAIAGQRGDLSATQAADAEEVKRVELSEMFHNIIQAAGRGSCRNTHDGKALPMSLALICNDQFPDEWWQSAMPGVRVVSWDGKHATPAKVRGEHERAILRALSQVPSRVQSVSTKALRGLAKLDQLSPISYSRAVQRALTACSGWQQQGRSVIRNPFATAG